MWLLRWVRGHHRRAYVVPVRLAPPPWSHDAVATIRRAYFRHRHERLDAWVAMQPDVAALAPLPTGWARWRAWFVEDVLAMSLQALRRHGRWVRHETGKPRWRQWLEMAWLAVRLPAMPETYYKFEWYLPRQRLRARSYLHRYELKRVVYLLLAPGPAAASLKDKHAFAEQASESGLPVPRTFGTIVDGALRFTDGIGVDDLQRDLFVKPIDGKGGRGADRLRYLAGQDAPYHSDTRGRAYTLQQLLDHCAERSRKPRYRRGFMLQALVPNHPDVAPLAGAATSTCRIVTMLDESGSPEPIIAIFRMAGSVESVVDNSHAGGMAAPVDLASGRLGAAAFLAHDASLARYAEHPDTGARIDGAVLPRWDEVVALALRAHRSFSDYVLIGWDIAITPDGPVIIEGNDQPCPEGLQRRHRLPLGDQRFGELLAWHLRARRLAR